MILLLYLKLDHVRLYDTDTLCFSAHLQDYFLHKLINFQIDLSKEPSTLSELQMVQLQLSGVVINAEVVNNYC